MSARRGKPFRPADSGSRSRRKSPSPSPPPRSDPPAKKPGSFKIPKKTAPAVPTAFGREENRASSKGEGFERKSLLEEGKDKKPGGGGGGSSILSYAKDVKERKTQSQLLNLAEEEKDPPVRMV